MKRIMLRFAAAALAAAVCLCVFAFADKGSDDGQAANSTQESSTVSEKTYSAVKRTDDGEQEMRAVWLPFMSLQLTEDERSREGFEKKISSVLDRCRDHGANTVIVHVRPFGDAVYPSSYYPWSHILTGEQGKALPFDPLELIVSASHSRGLAIHAWINPLRISTGRTPEKLSDDNPYIKWKGEGSQDDFFEYKDGIYYDPSSPRVRRLITDGVRELVGNYEIDGVQIDDYFYPEEFTSHDELMYKKYVSSVSEGCRALTIEEWRRNNVNMLVAGLYDAVHGGKREVVFGISPQCNFENNEKISADIKSWCTLSGYADYICPQIYVTDEHPVFPFGELLDKWRKTVSNSNIRLYIGLGLYKAGTEADDGTWLGSNDNLAKQICTLREKGANGFMLYSYDYLDKPETEQELKNLLDVL